MSKKVYVVEDMAISRAALIDMLEDNGYEIVGSSASADKAWIEIKDLDIDIALLDINLAGEKDGIWLAKMIRKHKNMPVVFLTAYGDDKTLAELQKVEPNGYLMKPYNTPTLITMIDIACRSFKISMQNKNNAVVSGPSILIKEGGVKVKLYIAEIRYLKSEGNYLEIITAEKKHIIREKLSYFLTEMPKDYFVQVHRRFAVHLDHVEKISATYLYVLDTKIPISKTYKEKVIKFLEK